MSLVTPPLEDSGMGHLYLLTIRQLKKVIYDYNPHREEAGMGRLKIPFISRPDILVGQSKKADRNIGPTVKRKQGGKMGSFQNINLGDVSEISTQVQ